MVYRKKRMSELTEAQKADRRRRVRQCNIRWKQKHPEKYKEVTKNYWSNHYHEIREKHRIRNNAYKYFRNRILLARGNACEECGSKENLDIHHIKYENNPKYVKVVCRLCHRAIHDKMRREQELWSK